MRLPVVRGDTAKNTEKNSVVFVTLLRHAFPFIIPRASNCGRGPAVLPLLRGPGKLSRAHVGLPLSAGDERSQATVSTFEVPPELGWQSQKREYRRFLFLQ